MWQDLRSELHPKGLEIVTVALDVDGLKSAGRWIKRAKPEHPSLIDQSHKMDELFGIVNVPSGIWIDEDGMIVRPPETAYPGKVTQLEVIAKMPAKDPDPYLIAQAEETMKMRVRPKKYYYALLDWVDKGAGSQYALSPDEVVERSRPAGREASEAAAHFELGQHLHRLGHEEGSIHHFREAHRLQPENWTYKRQAWSMVDPNQGPSDVYEGDWVTDVRRLGPENYYAPLEM